MAFNASEEAIREMFGMYSGMIEEIMNRTGSLANETIQWAGSVRYKPAVDMAKDMIQYYNTDLRKSITKAMEQWRDSDGSFHAFMNRKHAGENAIKTGKAIESEIIESIKGWPMIDGEPLNQIDTSNPVVSSEALKQLSDYVNKYNKDLSDYGSQMRRSVETKAEDNTMYTSIEPVVHLTTLVIEDGFKQVKKAEDNLASEFESSEKSIRSGSRSATDELGKNVRNHGETSFENMRKSAKTIIE